MKPWTIVSNLHDRELLAQIEAVDIFMDNMHAYPGRTFGQLYHRFFRSNDLADGRLALSDRVLDLAAGRSRCSRSPGAATGSPGGRVPPRRRTAPERAARATRDRAGRPSRRADRARGPGTTWVMLDRFLGEHEAAPPAAANVAGGQGGLKRRRTPATLTAMPMAIIFFCSTAFHRRRGGVGRRNRQTSLRKVAAHPRRRRRPPASTSGNPPWRRPRRSFLEQGAGAGVRCAGHRRHGLAAPRPRSGRRCPVIGFVFRRRPPALLARKPAGPPRRAGRRPAARVRAALGLLQATPVWRFASEIARARRRGRADASSRSGPSGSPRSRAARGERSPVEPLVESIQARGRSAPPRAIRRAASGPSRGSGPRSWRRRTRRSSRSTSPASACACSSGKVRQGRRRRGRQARVPEANGRFALRQAGRPDLDGPELALGGEDGRPVGRRRRREQPAQGALDGCQRRGRHPWHRRAVVDRNARIARLHPHDRARRGRPVRPGQHRDAGPHRPVAPANVNDRIEGGCGRGRRARGTGSTPLGVEVAPQAGAKSTNDLPDPAWRLDPHPLDAGVDVGPPRPLTSK